MPDDSPFPERWLSTRRAERPDSDTLESIRISLSEQNLDEARLVARLKALTTSTIAEQRR